LGYTSVAESLGISSTTFTQCAPEATDFGEITQHNGHYAVQGHSRSPISVPVRSSYVYLPPSPTEGFPRRISVKFFVDVNGWPRYM